MKYLLPNNKIVDLEEYTIDDLIQIDDHENKINEQNQKELAQLLFKQSGIIVAG